jgi:hypothetical protein
VRELNDQINRLELRTEQLIIHLRSLIHQTNEAKMARMHLLCLLQSLVILKGERQRLEDGLELAEAA